MSDRKDVKQEQKLPFIPEPFRSEVESKVRKLKAEITTVTEALLKAREDVARQKLVSDLGALIISYQKMQQAISLLGGEDAKSGLIGYINSVDAKQMNLEQISNLNTELLRFVGHGEKRLVAANLEVNTSWLDRMLGTVLRNMSGYGYLTAEQKNDLAKALQGRDRKGTYYGDGAEIKYEQELGVRELFVANVPGYAALQTKIAVAEAAEFAIQKEVIPAEVGTQIAAASRAVNLQELLKQSQIEREVYEPLIVLMRDITSPDEYQNLEHKLKLFLIRTNFVVPSYFARLVVTALNPHNRLGKLREEYTDEKSKKDDSVYQRQKQLLAEDFKEQFSQLPEFVAVEEKVHKMVHARQSLVDALAKQTENPIEDLRQSFELEMKICRATFAILKQDMLPVVLYFAGLPENVMLQRQNNFDALTTMLGALILKYTGKIQAVMLSEAKKLAAEVVECRRQIHKIIENLQKETAEVAKTARLIA